MTRIRTLAVTLVTLVTALGLAPLVARGAAAQAPRLSTPQWEGRLDVLATPAPGVHAGGGVNIGAGPYARVGVTAAIGAVRDAGEIVASRRADATVRFLLDPFAERRRGLYAGAGLSLRSDGNDAWRGNITLVLGLEGRVRSGAVRAIELALGGGVRLGVVWRTRRAGQYR